MHSFLYILEHIVNSVIFATQVRQLSKFCYRLVYKCSNTLYVRQNIRSDKNTFCRVMIRGGSRIFQRGGLKAMVICINYIIYGTAQRQLDARMRVAG